MAERRKKETKVEEKEEVKADQQEREKSHPPSSSAKPGGRSASAKAFSFWAYFTLITSLVTFLLATLYSLQSNDDYRSWFLSLPDDLRHHYSKGKLVKSQVSSGRPPIEVFAIEHGPRDAETILLLHGLGCSSYSFRRVLQSLGSSGFRAVAIDLPGSGFSGKLVLEESARWGGVLGRVWEVYREIKEKGLFWGFDQLIETGQIPYEEIRARVSVRNDVETPSGYGSQEMGQIIGQVVDSLSLSHVHLVLHDSALGAGASWVSSNLGAVRSVTFIDSSSNSAAFPSWILGTPVIRVFVLRSRLAFAGLLRLCCSRSIDGSVAEAYRLLLKGNDESKAVVAAGKALNYSFDLGEWAGSSTVKDVPLQVLWSNTWSDAWIEEGRLVSDAIPQAKFGTHFGGRWPQEDAAEEIAGKISDFVSSLPKSTRQIDEEPLPEHIQKMFDEASNSHHHHHHHGHAHEHAAGYMDVYGLSHGWGN